MQSLVMSPVPAFRIELFKVGFEYNPSTDRDVLTSNDALKEYLSNLWKLTTTKVEGLPWGIVQTSGGVLAIGTASRVHMFTVGSTSRKIHWKAWKPIAFPNHNPVPYCFHPGTDVIAFVELQTGRCVHCSRWWD